MERKVRNCSSLNSLVAYLGDDTGEFNIHDNLSTTLSLSMFKGNNDVFNLFEVLN